ncbi:MAG TPA: hypothetical protein VNY05_23380 [Candidatus Acidoferrales bacterium]|nr:hypothetical protein [Candidatus Acidoferrales bacterium]
MPTDDGLSSAKDPKDRDWMLDEFSRSTNPVIALYAQLESGFRSSTAFLAV